MELFDMQLLWGFRPWNALFTRSSIFSWNNSAENLNRSHLFFSFPQLIDLKNDQSGENQTQTNAQDRYQELLGRRANFLLHAVVAVLSFLIFGAVPLVIYGVVINKNYYTEVKLAAVAASSVVCIILLAIGKVYTRRPPNSYFKTVFYYVTLALSASGVSYLAGNLIKDLLEKFNHSESGFAITMPISDTSMKSAWMSYWSSRE